MINTLFIIDFIGISLKHLLAKAPIKNRFIFVMVITKNRCLRVGLRYVSWSIYNARMSWFKFSPKSRF